jgi:protein-tyrosine kinase
MSRIDEALRRSERADQSHTGSGTLERAAADGLQLDAYPAELRTAATTIDHERRTPPTPPHIVRAAIAETPADPAKLATLRAIDPIALEQYTRLAAALEEAQSARSLKRLMITSAVPREGKTLTTVNLALTLSESYKRRVLVIDADFRRPNIHELFGLPNDSGVAALLRKPDAVCRPIQLSATLHVLPAGALDSSPTAALTSDRMLQLVEQSAAQFDWVLLDTPPVTLLSDAQLVARISDGVLLVVAAATTPYTLVQRTIEELGADRIVGTLLNRAASDVLPARQYYGHYYQAAAGAGRE